MKSFLFFLLVIFSVSIFADFSIEPGHGNPWLDPNYRDKSKRDGYANSKVMEFLKINLSSENVNASDHWTVIVASSLTATEDGMSIFSTIEAKKPGPLTVKQPIRNTSGSWLKDASRRVVKKETTLIKNLRYGLINIESEFHSDIDDAAKEVADAATTFLKTVITRKSIMRYWGVFGHNNKRNRNMKHFLALFLNNLDLTESRDILSKSQHSVYGKQKYAIKHGVLTARIGMTLYTAGVHFKKINVAGKIRIHSNNQSVVDRTHRILLKKLAKIAADKLLAFYKNTSKEEMAALIYLAQKKKATKHKRPK